jgi:hypothetical protein
VLARRTSDHNPILVSCRFSGAESWKKCKSFRYDAGWNSHVELQPLIQQVWRAKPPKQNKWHTVQHNLRSCQHVFQRWVRKHGNPVEEKIKSKTQELLEVQKVASSTTMDTDGDLMVSWMFC